MGRSSWRTGTTNLCFCLFCFWYCCYSEGNWNCLSAVVVIITLEIARRERTCLYALVPRCTSAYIDNTTTTVLYFAGYFLMLSVCVTQSRRRLPVNRGAHIGRFLWAAAEGILSFTLISCHNQVGFLCLISCMSNGTVPKHISFKRCRAKYDEVTFYFNVSIHIFHCAFSF